MWKLCHSRVGRNIRSEVWQESYDCVGEDEKQGEAGRHSFAVMCAFKKGTMKCVDGG